MQSCDCSVNSTIDWTTLRGLKRCRVYWTITWLHLMILMLPKPCGHFEEFVQSVNYKSRLNYLTNCSKWRLSKKRGTSCIHLMSIPTIQNTTHWIRRMPPICRVYWTITRLHQNDDDNVAQAMRTFRRIRQKCQLQIQVELFYELFEMEIVSGACN